MRNDLALRTPLSLGKQADGSESQADPTVAGRLPGVATAARPRREPVDPVAVETEQALRVASRLKGLEIRVDRNGLVAPKISDSPLPDAKGDLQALGKELQRVGIQ